MKIFLTFIPIAMLIACQSSTNSSTNTENGADTSTVSANALAANMSCYQGAIGHDTFQMKVQRGGSVATGMLAYLFSEKDKSSGHLTGKLYGDTLIADYTYFSEGTKSVRQVAFLLSGDEAIEGYGPQTDYEGKMIFNTRKDITFGSGVKMQKGNCDVITIVVPKPMMIMQGSLKGTWELEFISGTKIAFDGLFPNKKPQLTFITNQPVEFSGNSGCNNLHGKCKFNGNILQFVDPITMTKMACPGNGEQTFLDMLKKINKYGIVNDKLELKVDDKVMMRLARK
jgi:heat shock protein HslJ